MTCPNCGAAVADNRRFCGKCGASVVLASEPQPPPAPAPAAPQPPAWGSSAPPAQPPPIPQTAAGPADPFAPPDLNPQPGYGQAGYPPPGYGSAPYPPPPYPPPGYGQPGYPPPGYAQPGYGQPGYGQPGYGAPPGWQGYGPQPVRTNGLGIAAFVLGLVGWPFFGLGSAVAIVFGFVALDQIRRSFGTQGGKGLAIAGIVLGFLGAGFWVLALIGSIFSAGST